jgi:hypothetical protein
MSTAVSLYTILTVWWHKCRYQLLSSDQMDYSMYFGREWLFGQLLAAKECMSACGICTSAREALLFIYADVTDYILRYPVSHSIPLHCISVSSYIISVLYHNTWKFTVFIKRIWKKQLLICKHICNTEQYQVHFIYCFKLCQAACFSSTSAAFCVKHQNVYFCKT